MEPNRLNDPTPVPQQTAAPETEQPEAKKEARKPEKELTPAQMQKRRKALVLPLFFLIFGAAMWLIFAPSGKEKEEDTQRAGLNTELPVPEEDGLVGDKREAYEQEAMQQKQQEKMQSLQDFALMLGGEEEPGTGTEVSDESPSRDNGSAGHQPTATTAIQSSAAAYQDINRQLEAWNEQPATEEDDQAQLALEWRIQELERKQQEAEQRAQAEDDQFAMLEKSYQLAAKYMPQGQTMNGTAQRPAGAAGETEAKDAPASALRPDGKATVQPVKQVHAEVISLLAAPLSDAEFVREYAKPRNAGFLTAAGNETLPEKNSIRACVYQSVTLTNGKELPIRLLEAMQAGDVVIPANTVVTGSCRISGERMEVTVHSIQYAGTIIPVELQVYDTDGQPGISVPGNDALSAAKEIAATLANSAGTSITITDDAGSQLATDMGKGLIQGASQFISKKMNTVKITLKAGYRLLLLPNNQ